MNHPFPEIKKNFGFGCMRLPMQGDKVDIAEFSQMVDTFLQAGFNYFDTAHVYIGGQSETALREGLTSRYPRDAYILTDKLSGPLFQCEEDIRPLVEKQLAACGVEYFDFYLMHAQNRNNFAEFKNRRAYETVLQLKEEGKIRHMGISFHDKADILDQILTEYPQIEVVQIQFNYLDYEDDEVDSRRIYEVCRRHGKPVIVMEPVKGGSLVDIPKDAQALLNGMGSGSNASYAIRFAAGFEGVCMVLSGMGSMAMMTDNVSTMQNFVPLTEEETAVLHKVSVILHNQDLVPCTGCRYCVDGCPMHISIPDWFSMLNSKRTFREWEIGKFRPAAYADGNGTASACLGCGQCEEACPQHIEIRRFLAEAAETFEKR